MSGLAFCYGWFVLPESLEPEKRMAFPETGQPVRRDDACDRTPNCRAWRSSPSAALRTTSSAVFVLYAGHRYGWTALQVGSLLALVGVLDMIVQGVLVGPAVRRVGDRAVMVFGLFAGAVGIACMGLAPTGLFFVLAMLPNALWGLAMPTLQSLMTRRVSESEQGQLQGANMSVA